MPLDNERKDIDREKPNAFYQLLNLHNNNPVAFAAMDIMLRIIVGLRKGRPLHYIILRLKEELPSGEVIDKVKQAIERYES
jgi:hypothetical protein